ncbi:MAG: hypothetical protein ACQETB_10025, partial [Halobacteriota archaeon]
MRNQDRSGGRTPDSGATSRRDESDDEASTIGPAFGALAESIEEAVCVFDVERAGQALAFAFRANNSTHERHTGLSAPTHGGRSPTELFGDADGRAIEDAFRRCVTDR